MPFDVGAVEPVDVRAAVGVAGAHPPGVRLVGLTTTAAAGVVGAGLGGAVGQRLVGVAQVDVELVAGVDGVAVEDEAGVGAAGELHGAAVAELEGGVAPVGDDPAQVVAVIRWHRQLRTAQGGAQHGGRFALPQVGRGAHGVGDLGDERLLADVVAGEQFADDRLVLVEQLDDALLGRHGRGGCGWGRAHGARLPCRSRTRFTE